MLQGDITCNTLPKRVSIATKLIFFLCWCSWLVLKALGPRVHFLLHLWILIGGPSPNPESKLFKFSLRYIFVISSYSSCFFWVLCVCDVCVSPRERGAGQSTGQEGKHPRLEKSRSKLLEKSRSKVLEKSSKGKFSAITDCLFRLVHLQSNFFAFYIVATMNLS